MRLGLVLGALRFGSGTLGLQRREGALLPRFLDITGSASTASNAAVGHRLLELIAGVAAAPVRVVCQVSSLPRRHTAISGASETNDAIMLVLSD